MKIHKNDFYHVFATYIKISLQITLPLITTAQLFPLIYIHTWVFYYKKTTQSLDMSGFLEMEYIGIEPTTFTLPA